MARRRWHVRFGKWLAVLLVALGALLLAVVFALRTSYARELIRTQVNAALGPLFEGRIQIDRIGDVTLLGVSGVDARIYDPSGRQVIHAQGLRAFSWLPGLGWQFVAHGDAPQLDIFLVHVDHADVTLREDEELGVTLASTFMPRETAEPSPPSSGPGPTVRLGDIRFDHVWAHGQVAGSPPLDAELTQLRANLIQSPFDGFELELESAELVSRALPLEADPSGTVRGSIEVPEDEARPMRMELFVDGRAAQSPLALEATWIGDRLHATVRLAQLPADYVNRQAPGLGLDGVLSVAAEIDGELPELEFSAEIDGTAAHVEAEGSAVLSGGLEAQASVGVARLDLARVVPNAPPSDLRLLARAVLFEDEEGELRGSQRVDVDAGTIAGLATPALWLTGTLGVGDAGFRTRGKLGADEAGASLRASYDVALPASGLGRVTTEAQIQLDDPGRLARLGVVTAGEARLTARFVPETQAVTARATLSLRRLDVGRLQTRGVEVQGQVAGTLSDPHVTAATTLNLLSGRVHADLDYSAAKQRLELFAADLDLKRLGLAFDTPLPLETATLGMDLCIERGPKSARYTLEGTANANLGQVGQAKLVASALELPDSGASFESLARLHGELSAKGNLDLEQLSPLLTSAGLPLERTSGRVRFDVSARHLQGDDRGMMLAAYVDSNALRIVGERKTMSPPATTGEAVDNSPMALEGIDVHLAVHSEPKTGTAVATVILRDHGGTLVEAQAEAQLSDLFGPRARPPSELPLRAQLHMPERKLQSLPPLFRPAVLRGRVSVDVKLAGTPASPKVSAAFEGRSLRAPGSRDPLDLDAEARFDLAGGKLRLTAKKTRTGAEVALLETDWQGDLRRAPELASGVAVLTGNASAKLSEFPFDVVPSLVDRQVQGHLSGEVKLSNWGRDARLEAKLSSNSLSVSNITLSDFHAVAHTQADRLLAELDLTTPGGKTHASLDASMRWGRRAAPELGHEGVAKLSTRGFRLEMLTPLIGQSVSEIGGTLDAETQITVSPTSTRVAGNAQIHHGSVQVPAIGQRFSEIEARVVVGDNRFKLERFDAHGLTGKLSATGSAELDGFELRGAEGKLVILERSKLPITLEGVAIGDAWGNVVAKYTSPRQGERKLRIDVPEFHLITPETGGGSLQSLDDPEAVRIGVRRADGKFVPLAVQPLEPGGGSEAAAQAAQPLRIEVKLGNAVTVARGRTAQAQLTGQIQVLSAATTEVTGRIEIHGGKLDVQGKNFEIERGVVTFDGKDPSNPTITATARWDAPDYTVYAEYLGDVENGRIKLHSEPPLTQDEIASLLLFGSPDGSPGSGDGSNAALAVSVAGDSAARGLTRVLDDFTNLDVSARIDTSTGSARPELVVRISPRLAAKVSRAVGTPAAGESPDRTYLTLEMRLRRAWALSAIFGDQGASALDLIWRRRY